MLLSQSVQVWLSPSPKSRSRVQVESKSKSKSRVQVKSPSLSPSQEPSLSPSQESNSNYKYYCHNNISYHFDPFIVSKIIASGTLVTFANNRFVVVFPNSYVSENVSSFRCSRTGNEDWFDRDKAGACCRGVRLHSSINSNIKERKISIEWNPVSQTYACQH